MIKNIFSFLIAFATCHAQSISRMDEHLLFKEAKSSQAVLILNDSLLYKGNPLQKKTFRHENYSENLKNYLPFYIHDKTYFAYHGCGAVLEWRNDSIIRIDKSFLHKNQYGAVTFAYKNKLFFWGGYGLFTYKNILTQFNFKTKEWDEIETFGTPPTARKMAHSIVINDDLFVFSGYEKDEYNFLQIKECKSEVWKLHLSTMQWSLVGKYSPLPNLISKEAIAANFSINKKLYIIPIMVYNTIYEVDIVKNSVTTYRTNPKNVLSPFFDATTNQVVYINKNADGFKSVMRSPLKEFLGHPISQQSFLLPWYQSIEMSTIVLVVFSVLFLIGLLRYFQQKKKRFVPFTGIIYSATKEAYYYRGKLLDSFEDAELRILDYLVQQMHRYISLNELNHLFENDIQKDSFLTVVKRREVALTSLLAKLVFITSNEEKDILDKRKSANDKRVKEIKLKESFIKVK